MILKLQILTQADATNTLINSINSLDLINQYINGSDLINKFVTTKDDDLVVYWQYESSNHGSLIMF